MSYIILRGRWCNIIVLNVQSDDVMDSFYEEVESVFVHFARYDMSILLGDFKVKVVREHIFEPKIWNDSSHEIINDNRVTDLLLK
jgi:hypothetical protein